MANDRFNDDKGLSTRDWSKKNDPASECLGQSVGGWTTNIHAVVDALGNPLQLILSVGEWADITQAERLRVVYEIDAVIADIRHE